MQTPPGKQHYHEEMEVILLRKTHLPQERCTSLFAKMRTSLFANCSTFLFAKKRTLLFAVYNITLKVCHALLERGSGEDFGQRIFKILYAIGNQQTNTLDTSML